MNLDYSKHRLNDFTQLEKYKQELGKDVSSRFIDTVYSWLMKMQINDRIDITKKSEITNRNRDFFIKVVCLFIFEGNDSYLFTSDYTEVYRYDREKEKKETADFQIKLDQKHKKTAEA